jgi:hypothetical protein
VPTIAWLPMHVAMVVCVSAAPAYPPQSASAVAQAPLNVLKITAGPTGAESNGTFVLTEERTVFSRVNDREVIVFFQWDGVPGAHKLVAQWRSPDGGLTSSSAIDYVAKDRRFGAYWRLSVSTTMPPGTWSIEATVDGQPGGRLTFDIRDEKVAPVVVKRPLTQAELYERLNRAFVVIERSSAAGRRLEPAGGFVTGSTRIYTSLSAIDAADRVAAIGADGARRDVASIASWHRRQDWAILEGSVPQDALPVAAGDSAKVGDRIYSIEGGTTGRALTEGGLTGQSDLPGVGRRLLATFSNGTGTPGAPVLNEFGELVGMVGGAHFPGATRLLDLLRARGAMKGIPIVPMTELRVRPDAAPEAITAMQLRGDLIAALTGEEHVVSGGFAKQINRGPAVAPADQREEFSSQDKTFVTWINWSPQERVRGQGSLRMFDADNRVVMASKPAKIDLRKGQLSLSSWQIPVPSTPGLYRVDAAVDGKPICRGFVRITQ